MEYIVWGKPQGAVDETILHSLSRSREEALRVIDVLTHDYHCTDCRIQELDISQPFDFARAAGLKK